MFYLLGLMEAIIQREKKEANNLNESIKAWPAALQLGLEQDNKVIVVGAGVNPNRVKSSSGQIQSA